MNLISDKTRIALGTGIGIAVSACTIWASVSVSQARTEEMLAMQNKQIDYNIESRDKMIRDIADINARTARMEGILEEMRDSRHR